MKRRITAVAAATIMGVAGAVAAASPSAAAQGGVIHYNNCPHHVAVSEWVPNAGSNFKLAPGETSGRSGYPTGAVVNFQHVDSTTGKVIGQGKVVISPHVHLLTPCGPDILP